MNGAHIALLKVIAGVRSGLSFYFLDEFDDIFIINVRNCFVFIVTITVTI